MSRILALAVFIGLGLSAPVVMADLEENLIKLDREWGEATKPEQLKGLLTEKFISVDADGIADRKQLMDALAKSTPSDEPYVAGGYTVQMVDDKVAVMVHSAGSGDDKHWSMHVWRKHDGKWKVAATATIAAED